MYKYINGEHPCVFFTRVELPKLEMIEKEALLYLTEDENKFESFKKGEIRVNNNIAYKLFILTNKCQSYWLSMQEKHDILKC